MPARVAGYATFASLVCDTIVEAAGMTVSGVIGLPSCVSCSWPVLASVAASVFGGGTAVMAIVMTPSHDLSTLVFLIIVLLL